MLSSHSVVFFSFTSCLGNHFATVRKLKPYNGHFALCVLIESLELFLCVNNVTEIGHKVASNTGTLQFTTVVDGTVELWLG